MCIIILSILCILCMYVSYLYLHTHVIQYTVCIDWSGGDASLGEGGEALTVVDKHEAWVFHVMGDDTGTSAIWVAKRVPYGHVSSMTV